MNSADILIIGGGPAAAVCAGTATTYYPDKNITIIKDTDPSVVPCGIPYMIGSLESPDKNIMSFGQLKTAGVEILIDRVEKLDRVKKNVQTAGNAVYNYEKLVIATGSYPLIPHIKGVELNNVFAVKKDFNYLKAMVDSIKRSNKIAVIGGGFIGVEFCDEISRLNNKDIYLIEMLPDVIANSFDKEFSDIAAGMLKQKGVNLITGVRVEELLGNKEVHKVKLSNGDLIDVDMVILSIGGRPNTRLAYDAGLSPGMGSGIWVDEYMRTEDDDIFAVGDCSGKRDFFTRKNTSVMLASTATAEARIAGSNLYELKVIRENKGTIAAYSTYLSGLVLASAGLTENTAKKEHFEFVVGEAEGVDKHPGALPGACRLKVKLVFSRQSGVIIGGQVSGGSSAGEIINIIGLAIQKNVSMSELESFQMATHPYLTPPPTKYHIVQAAMDAVNQCKKGG